MNALLDALGYIGSSLDKPGAAVRGALSGDMGQLANLIPFSDAMGITDPEQRVSGRDMLQSWGAVGENQEGFDLGDVAGFGAEMLTNPLSYVPLGGMASRLFRGPPPSTTNALLGARRGFTMAKDVGEEGVGRLVGQSGRAGAAELAGELAANPGAQGAFVPSLNAGAVASNAAANTGRHEIIHGMLNQGMQTGNTQGMPLMMRGAVGLKNAAGTNETGFLRGIADLGEELTAQTLENRGLLNQAMGAGRFLLQPGARHAQYADWLAQSSPLVSNLYRYAPHAAIGGTAAGAGGAAYSMMGSP